MNNYNNNSKGLNLEFDGVYDNHLAQSTFSENFTENDGQWIYNPYMQHKDLEKEFTLNKGVTLKQFILYVANDYYQSSSTCENFKDFKDGCFLNQRWSSLTFDDVLEMIDDLSCTTQEYNETLSTCDLVTGNYIEVDITGYSQRDFATVIVFNELKLTFDPKSYFEHLFYDSPISGSLLIEGDNYYIDEYSEDTYWWDKKQFLKSFFSKTEFTEDEQKIITDFLPTELEYLT